MNISRTVSIQISIVAVAVAGLVIMITAAVLHARGPAATWITPRQPENNPVRRTIVLDPAVSVESMRQVQVSDLEEGEETVISLRSADSEKCTLGFFALSVGDYDPATKEPYRPDDFFQGRAILYIPFTLSEGSTTPYQVKAYGEIPDTPIQGGIEVLATRTQEPHKQITFTTHLYKYTIALTESPDIGGRCGLEVLREKSADFDSAWDRFMNKVGTIERNCPAGSKARAAYLSRNHGKSRAASNLLYRDGVCNR